MLIMKSVGQILLLHTCADIEAGLINTELDGPFTELSSLFLFHFFFVPFFLPKNQLHMNGWRLQNIPTASCLGIYHSFKEFLLIVKSILYPFIHVVLL